MRHVEIHSFISNIKAEEVYETLLDFQNYVKLVDTVLSVDIVHKNYDSIKSSWVVKFRNGLLRWTEEDWFNRKNLRIDFKQIDGDFEEFFGFWQLKPEKNGVKADLIVDFDFGIESLASIINPVAERVLTEVTQQTLLGLFDDKVKFSFGERLKDAV